MKTFTLSRILAGAAAAMLAIAALAAEATLSKSEDPAGARPGHAVINFADLPHTIDSWDADGIKGIYLRVGLNKWYHAVFMAPCLELPFHVSVGIVTDGLSQVDRFSSIIVGSHVGSSPERCWFKSVDEVSGPPGRAEAKSS